MFVIIYDTIFNINICYFSKDKKREKQNKLRFNDTIIADASYLPNCKCKKKIIFARK